MNPDDASRTPPETRSIAAAVLVVFGVAVFLYGGWLFYGEVTMTPYTYVAEEVDASDVDERSLSVVEFHELSEDERAAFLEMVEREGPGDGYHSDSDEPPIGRRRQVRRRGLRRLPRSDT